MSPRPRVSFRLYLITDRRVVKSGDLISACEAALTVARQRAARNGRIATARKRFIRARSLRAGAAPSRILHARRCAADRERSRRCGNRRGADGVHLPVDSIGVSMARKLLGPDRLIGVSSHSPPDVAGAAREGADFAVFGPVFDPLSKPAGGSAWGASGLRRRAARARFRSSHSAASRPSARANCSHLPTRPRGRRSRVDRSDIWRRLAGPGYCGDAVGA